jgi:DnaJ-class molecular chaperone
MSSSMYEVGEEGRAQYEAWLAEQVTGTTGHTKRDEAFVKCARCHGTGWTRIERDGRATFPCDCPRCNGRGWEAI